MSVFDWRHVAVLLGAFIVAAFLFIIIDAGRSRSDSLRTAQSAVQHETSAEHIDAERIDQLHVKIDVLTKRVQDSTSQQATEVAQIDALINQVRQLGGRPVVNVLDRTVNVPVPVPVPITTTTQAPKSLTTTIVPKSTTTSTTIRKAR